MTMDYEIIIRFLLALLWGGIVGAEREYHSKSAGFRTMIMISIGACFFTMMSMRIGGANNPDRIASNIVTGIGFLGAGVIFRGENRINGITTAATIWAVAAVGMGIGAGYYTAAACASVLTIIILSVLPYAEKIIDRLNQTRTYNIECKFSVGIQKHYEQSLLQFGLKYKLIKEIKTGDDLSISWQVQGHETDHKLFIAAMMADVSVQRFEY